MQEKGFVFPYFHSIKKYIEFSFGENGFGEIDFGEIDFGEIDFGKIDFGEIDFPILTEITDFQDTVKNEEKKLVPIEIDLLGKCGKNILLLGECKFKNSPFDKTEYEKLMDKIKFIPANQPLLCIFSLHGFTDYVKENAKNCKLISIEEMYC